MDDSAKNVGIRAAVVIGRPRFGNQRRGEEILGRVIGMVGVGVYPAVPISCGHGQQMAHGHRIHAIGRGARELWKVFEDRIVQVE